MDSSTLILFLTLTLTSSLTLALSPTLGLEPVQVGLQANPDPDPNPNQGYSSNNYPYEGHSDEYRFTPGHSHADFGAIHQTNINTYARTYIQRMYIFKACTSIQQTPLSYIQRIYIQITDHQLTVK